MAKKTAKQLDRDIAHALNNRGSAHARKHSADDLEVYSKEQLERKPTISEGHSEDLKIERKLDGVPTRWWLSRMTTEDGVRNSIDVEQLHDGRWNVVHRYGEPDRSSDRSSHATRSKTSHARTGTLYVVKVPPTKEVGSYQTRVRGPMPNARRDALWDYNSARRHDGLPPVDRMPAGTKYAKQG